MPKNSQKQNGMVMDMCAASDVGGCQGLFYKLKAASYKMHFFPVLAIITPGCSLEANFWCFGIVPRYHSTVGAAGIGSIVFSNVGGQRKQFAKGSFLTFWI